MDNFLSFLIGILSSSVVAVSTIYFVFWKWKPRIEISKYIVEGYDKNNNLIYKIKLINRSKFEANDIKVELWKKTEYKATSNTKGFNESVEKVSVSTNEWLTIPKYINNQKINNLNYAPHCITLKIVNEDVNKILDITSNQSLEFKISVKHGLSNISKTFSMDYNDSNCLRRGRFIFGNSLETEEI